MKKILFYREFSGFTGGHLKHWHYFLHTKTSELYTPLICFPSKVNITTDNPWLNEKNIIMGSYSDINTDIYFLEGMDWNDINSENIIKSNKPIINLIQGIQHTDPNNPRYKFLKNKAIRICVSYAVEEALRNTHIVNGPILTIQNGLDVSDFPETIKYEDRTNDLLVVGVKRWYLTKVIEAIIKAFQFMFPKYRGLNIKYLKHKISRKEFLSEISNSKLALLLPLSKEGFYLPALEAMYLKVRVIVPNCIGNTDFCINKVNCYFPRYNIFSIFLSAFFALKETPDKRDLIDINACQTVANFSIDSEREKYLELLNNLNKIWDDN